MRLVIQQTVRNTDAQTSMVAAGDKITLPNDCAQTSMDEALQRTLLTRSFNCKFCRIISDVLILTGLSLSS